MYRMTRKLLPCTVLIFLCCTLYVYMLSNRQAAYDTAPEKQAIPGLSSGRKLLEPAEQQGPALQEQSRQEQPQQELQQQEQELKRQGQAQREQAQQQQLQQEQAQREKDQRDKAQREQAQREKEQQEQARREKEQHEKDQREREQREREQAQREKEQREKEQREKEQREKEQREKEQREKEQREKEQREKEQREKEQREKEQREQEQREKEKLEQEQRQREQQQCMNGGLSIQDACMCPSQTNEYCEQGDCLQKMDSRYELKEEWTAKPWEGNLTDCDIHPAYFGCWKGMYLQCTSTFSMDNQSVSDDVRMKYLYARYGPWSDNDKLMLRYLVGDLRYRPSQPPKAPTTPRLAFVIMGHGYWERLGKLLDSIYNTRHIYMIYVDGKVPNSDYELVVKYVQFYNKERNFTNVYVLENRFQGRWGGISLVYQEVGSIVQLLRLTEDDPWSHVINLSLHDYPVKPLSYIEQFFSTHLNITFIDVNGWIRESRYKELHIPCNRGDIRDLVNLKLNVSDLYPTTPVDNWMWDSQRIYGEGCQWHAISREFAEYIATSKDAFETLFAFKYTLIPDESYFQTMMLNSPFTSTHVRMNLRYLPWGRQLNVIESDIEVLKSSNQYFFTRKVYNESLYALLDEHLVKAPVSVPLLQVQPQP